jgi:hypothetical protein
MSTPLSAIYRQGRGQPAGAPQEQAPEGGGSLSSLYRGANTDVQVSDVDESVQSAAEEPSNLVPAAAGVAAVGGAAWLLSKLKNAPGVLGKVGKGAEYANAVRQQMMLSGFAPVKSILGNIGAGVEEAVEGKGLGALKEIVSARTAKEAFAAMRSGAGQNNNPAGAAVNLPAALSLPGRFMSGADEATRAAMQRIGRTPEEAASAVMQAPLTGRIGEVLESPIARFVHPFRRTPFNQFIEGWDKIKAGTIGGDAAARRGLKLYGAAGAVHGAATSDESMPLSVPFGVAASSRYGLPYALSAIAGRSLAGGKGHGGIESSALPVGEYGLGQAADPKELLTPFMEPAALRALRKLAGEQ